MSAETTTEKNSTAGVIPAAPWRIKALSVLPGYRLAVTFMDGRSGVVDCSGITRSSSPGVFAPLVSEAFFAQAALDLGVVTWPNGADLDPGWIYEALDGRESWAVPF